MSHSAPIVGLAWRGGALGKGKERGRLKGRRRSRLLHNPKPAQSLGGSYRVGVCQGGRFSVCVCVGGGQEERQRRRESYPGTPEQFVTLEWLLSYPGGPPHSGRVFRSQSGEQGGVWSSREGSEVMAYSSPGGASVSGAGGWGRRKRKEAKKGGGRKARCLLGLRFLWHACKTSGEISV